MSLLLNLDGIPQERIRHRAFGEEKLDYWTPVIAPWGFCSKRVDPDAGLVYFGRRDYDPTLGRWITPDPQGFDDGPNLYAYVHNNPLTHLDPDGRYDVMDDNYSIADCSRFNCNIAGGFGQSYMNPFQTCMSYYQYVAMFGSCALNRDFSQFEKDSTAEILKNGVTGQENVQERPLELPFQSPLSAELLEQSQKN